MTFNELYDRVSSGYGEYNTRIIFDEKLDIYLPNGSNTSRKNYQFYISASHHSYYKELLNDILQNGGKFILCNVYEAYVCEKNKFENNEHDDKEYNKKELERILVDFETYNMDLSFDMETLIKSKSITIDEFISKYSHDVLVTSVPHELCVPYRPEYSNRIQCSVSKFIPYLNIFANLNMELKICVVDFHTGVSKYFTLRDGILDETLKLTTEMLVKYTEHQINEFNLMVNI